jgi:UDP-glucuronate 4-epimerase
MPKKVLVTGAAGFIGSHLCLAGRQTFGADVIGIDNFDSYYDPQLKRVTAGFLRTQDVDIVDLDLAADPLDILPTDIEVVFHAAAQPGICASTDFGSYLRNNIVATERMLRWAADLRSLQLFVYVSTSSVYGHEARHAEDMAPKPVSIYGVTKLAGEQLCLSRFRQNEFPACACRLYSVYGPRERPDKMIPRLLRAAFCDEPAPFYLGSGSHSRSFTFIDDAVRGLLLVGANPRRMAGEIVNIGMSTASTTADVLKMIEEITGRTIRSRVLPARPGDQTTTMAVCDRVQQLIGFRASVGLRDGLTRTIEWYLEQMAAQSPWAGGVTAHNAIETP